MVGNVRDEAAAARACRYDEQPLRRGATRPVRLVATSHLLLKERLSRRHAPPVVASWVASWVAS